jgi:diguanylate cyclase (GGDEF)-like protein
MDRERYRIASELSHDVLYEYYVDIDKMVYTEKYTELFGRYPVVSDYVKECYVRKDLIYPDDYGVFLEYCSSLSQGKEFVTAEFRIKDRHNNYIWCQIMGKAIYTEDKRPSMVIGKMVNVDYQKRELDSLEYKATRDPLTGVYNKEITIKKIEKYINGNKNGRHVFMFIDFDDFKKVNDNYGHLLGDRVLIHVIESIRSVFTEGEIIGRIGGDEFAVFIGYIENDKAIMRKAETLVEALNTTYVDETSKIAISGSVGIATYPEDGIHYEQLMQCADKALYHVKNKGKNSYMLYQSVT